MTCAEFQKVLPYIIETGGNTEEDGHLRSCPVCSDLVHDLKYIADQAKLLLPMQEPHPRVWTGIRSALEREGLVRPAAGTVGFRPPVATLTLPRRWGTVGGLMAFAALLLLGFGLLSYRNMQVGRRARPQVAATSSPSPVLIDDDDAQLLSAVQQRAPSMLATYKDNLNSVNTYIRDTQRTVEQNPDDVGARDHLMRAYDEKALLYEMALSRSLQ